MCGYNPFWIYEAMIDGEYEERTGGNMQGFYQAQQEYENRLFDPFGVEDYETNYYEDEDPEVDRRLEDIEW